ncbi:MAG TPA: TonB-dependent receptor [Candidatus Acidoferrales bacterium]|nr:TonB-dependent receptor [Candidatus Acidoferrales bacterium]
MLVAILLLLAALHPGFLHAGESPQSETLPPVIVSSSRLKDIEQEAATVPGKVVAITADDIAALGAKTIQEVLEYQTGVTVFDTVGNEFQSTVDLRGFNGQPVPATSVFVDGVRVNEPDFNTINFDLIPVEQIERIEILPGTATFFGRNALGGVINITTKRGRTDRPHVSLELGGGSYGRQKYAFAADGPLPLANFDYYFGVTRELTDGFRESSGGRITRLFGKLGYRLGESTDVTLSYTHVLDRLKQAGSLPLSVLHRDRKENFTPGDFSDSDLDLAVLNLRQKLPLGFSLALNGFVRDNRLVNFVNGQFSTSKLRTDILSAGTAAQLTHDSTLAGRRNLIHLGVEYAGNDFSILNTGEFSGFPFKTKQSTEEDVVGVYLSDSFNLFEWLILTAGFRYDRNKLDFTDKIDPSLSGAKAFSRISPKAGVVLAPSESLSFFFSYSEGMRTPTVTEIFAQGPFGSNPNLVPMKSRNYELGARARLRDWLDASVNLFYMPVRDEILFVVTDPATFTGRNENISRTLRRGLEASLKARLGSWGNAFLNYTLTKATFDTDVLLFSGQVKKGDELPQIPRHRVGAGISVHPVENLTLSLFGNYVSSQFLIGDEPNRGKKLADYFVLNQRIAYEWKPFLIHVTISNLTDRKYSTAGVLTGAGPFFVPAPGATFFAGVSLRY